MHELIKQKLKSLEKKEKRVGFYGITVMCWQTIPVNLPSTVILPTCTFPDAHDAWSLPV